MSSKIIFFVLLAASFAERPYVGLRVPQLLLDPFPPQIVGSGEAPKNGCPYIVSLQWGSSRDSMMHFCAGSILNELWIVTAAHCALAVPGYGHFVVKAGKHNIKTENTEQEVEVAQSWVHEKYGGGVGPYDIALIKLKKPLELTKEVQPIDLPEPESEPTGNSCLCVRGSVSPSGSQMPTKLQAIELPIIDRTTCDEAIRSLTGSSLVHETNICTGPLIDGGKSACSGDSGGPLALSNGQKSVLIGIMSWVIIPCTVDTPLVYTKVSKFVPWIDDKMNNN